jgi:hypothetical protein
LKEVGDSCNADLWPWLESADGMAQGLQRISVTSYYSGNNPDNLPVDFLTTGAKP